MKKITIDLGHGGHDPGAVGQGKTKEADVVLDIGKTLNNLLKPYNIDANFTRLTDKYLSLQERVNIANKSGSEYFLSIHINACDDKSVRGVEVWQYHNKDLRLSDFSNKLCSDISKLLNIKNRKVKLSNSLYVLKHTKMKAALLEVDFISNAISEKTMTNKSTIDNVANIIKECIVELLDLKPQPIYKVCIGTYNNKTNAMNALEEANKKGYKDAYII